MEKKGIKLSIADIIKYLIIFASIISAFAAQQVRINDHGEKIQDLRNEVKELKEAQHTAAEKAALMNGKLDIIIDYVQTINKSITNSKLHSTEQ